MSTTKTRRAALAAVSSLAVLASGACGRATMTSSATNTTSTTTATSATPTATQAQQVPIQPIPTATETQAAPRGGEPDWRVRVDDPDAVTDAVLRINETYDTRMDRSRNDAARRALPYLEDAYAAAVKQPMPGGAGADWIDLAQHDGYTTATVAHVEQDGAAPDTPTQASRVRAVTVTPHGAAGWTGTPTTTIYYVELVRQNASAPWKVSGITTR